MTSLQMAAALHREGKLTEAAQAYRDVLRHDPKVVEAISALATIHLLGGQADEAARLYQQALEIQPKQPALWNNHAVALAQSNRREEAIASFERATQIKSDNPETHYNRANLLKELGRFEEAITGFRTAISLKPDYAEAHNNCGVVCSRLNQYEEAIACFDKAVELRNNYVEAYNNRGVALAASRNWKAALASYNQAIACDPNYADAYWNKALVLLSFGAFKEGWPLYEWRWRRLDFAAVRRNFMQPQWLGQHDLTGKSVFVYAEQGLGDTIHFCRYLSLLQVAGARTIFGVQPEIKSLMRSLRPATELICPGDVIPPFDYHAPLMSLPAAFDTEISNIPNSVSYLTPSSTALGRWQLILGPRRRARVAVVWAGNRHHANEHNRSVSATEIIPLVRDDVDFISLQTRLDPDDKRFLFNYPAVRNVGEQLCDFDETAAVVSLSDLVITVDTAVAHLAGALAKPVWIMLPYVSDWRWFLDREDSPWYPTARLFRQEKPGDWQQVINKVSAQLAAFLAIEPTTKDLRQPM